MNVLETAVAMAKLSNDTSGRVVARVKEPSKTPVGAAPAGALKQRWRSNEHDRELLRCIASVQTKERMRFRETPTST